MGDNVGDLPQHSSSAATTLSLSVADHPLLPNAINETVLFAGGALQEGVGKTNQTDVVDVLNTTTMKWRNFKIVPEQRQRPMTPRNPRIK